MENGLRLRRARRMGKSYVSDFKAAGVLTAIPDCMNQYCFRENFVKNYILFYYQATNVAKISLSTYLRLFFKQSDSFRNL